MNEDAGYGRGERDLDRFGAFPEEPGVFLLPDFLKPASRGGGGLLFAPSFWVFAESSVAVGISCAMTTPSPVEIPAHQEHITGSRGKSVHAARAMLAKIYGEFTEGFEIADLKDAKRCSAS